MKKTLIAIFLCALTVIAQAQNMDIYHNCPMEGKVVGNGPADKQALEELNRLKNRYHIPRPEDYDPAVTLERLLGQQGVPDRGDFDPGKAATVEGYVVYAGDHGSKETCNCNTTSIKYQDQHIELALSPTELKDGRTITVEITPRLREIMDQQGVDWTHAEIGKLIGRKVRVSGWLFYDERHEKDACTFHPEKCGSGVSGYNRHTCWEIHPITYLKDITDESDEETYIPSVGESTSDATPDGTPPSSFAPPTYSSPTINTASMTTTPNDMLILVLLASLLGMAGQVIRLMVGLKKKTESAPRNSDGTRKSTIELIDGKQLAVSLFIALAVGAIAGILAAVNNMGISTLDKSVVFAFIAAGYAGTDLIEGFVITR